MAVDKTLSYGTHDDIELYDTSVPYNDGEPRWAARSDWFIRFWGLVLSDIEEADTVNPGAGRTLLYYDNTAGGLRLRQGDTISPAVDASDIGAVPATGGEFTGNIIVPNATLGTHALNRDSGDARYGQLGVGNTWLATNTFDFGSGRDLVISQVNTHIGFAFTPGSTNNYSRFNIYPVSDATESSRYFTLHFHADGVNSGLRINKGGNVSFLNSLLSNGITVIDSSRNAFFVEGTFSGDVTVTSTTGTRTVSVEQGSGFSAVGANPSGGYSQQTDSSGTVNNTIRGYGNNEFNINTGNSIFSANITIPNATAGTHAVNRDFGDARWVSILSLASQAEAETGTNNTKWMSPLRVTQAIDAQVSSAPVDSVFGRTGAVVAQSGDYSSFFVPVGGGTFSGNISIPNATAGGHALNRNTADGLYASTSHTHATLTAGTGLTGSSYNGGTARTWSVTNPFDPVNTVLTGVTEVRTLNLTPISGDVQHHSKTTSGQRLSTSQVELVTIDVRSSGLLMVKYQYTDQDDVLGDCHSAEIFLTFRRESSSGTLSFVHGDIVSGVNHYTASFSGYFTISGSEVTIKFRSSGGGDIPTNVDLRKAYVEVTGLIDGITWHNTA